MAGHSRRREERRRKARWVRLAWLGLLVLAGVGLTFWSTPPGAAQ